MPQLDFSVFPSQLFWLSVTFFAMLFVMSKIIIPRIAEMINLRREKIDDDLEKSAEIKEKAEEALERYHSALKQATDEANQSLQKTQQDLKNMTRQSLDVRRKSTPPSRRTTVQPQENMKAYISKKRPFPETNKSGANQEYKIQRRV